MRSMTVLLASACVSVMLQGCGTMYLDAPPDSNVRLLREYTPASVHVEKKVWFKWWGMEPLDDPHTATIIREHQLKEVRLYMVNTFTDGLVNIFPGMIGFPRRTLVVEGNP